MKYAGNELEYTLSEDGLVVSLPANGIRFDETLYKLQNITLLPYMGAGTYTNDGYTFIPDGSGALMDYADFSGARPRPRRRPRWKSRSGSRRPPSPPPRRSITTCLSAL